MIAGTLRLHRADSSQENATCAVSLCSFTHTTTNVPMVLPMNADLAWTVGITMRSVASGASALDMTIWQGLQKFELFCKSSLTVFLVSTSIASFNVSMCPVWDLETSIVRQNALRSKRRLCPASTRAVATNLPEHDVTSSATSCAYGDRRFA